MKMILKNIITILVVTIIPISLYLGYSDLEIDNFNSIIASIIVLEFFIARLCYDLSNYDHDYNNHYHQIPKQFFYVFLVIFNLLAFINILMIENNLKYLLFLVLIFSNGCHLLVKINKYFIGLIMGIVYLNTLFISVKYPTWILLLCMIFLGILYAYYKYHKKVTVYFEDDM